jgi:hypothetical protein
MIQSILWWMPGFDESVCICPFWSPAVRSLVSKCPISPNPFAFAESIRFRLPLFAAWSSHILV